MRKKPAKSNWNRSEGKLQSSADSVLMNGGKRQGSFIQPALNQGRPVEAVLKSGKKPKC